MFSTRRLDFDPSKTEDTSSYDLSGLNYPYKLNFYDQPPQYPVSIEEFETCALSRLRILAEVEASAARNRSWEETKTVVRAQCAQHLPLVSPSDDREEQEHLRRADHLGHFVLRLAFCRSEDLRRRFVKAENTVFRIRYEDTTLSERERFLNSRDFNWISVDPEEKRRYQKELVGYTPGKNDKEQQDAFDAERYYKVRWTRVPDLVDKRKVFLRSGWAYVPGREQSSIIFQEFQVQLEKALELTAKALPRLDEDTRIIPIINNLSQGFLAGVPSEWTSAEEGSGNEIKAEMVDPLARKHFPLCMRSLHDKLRETRHLKHYERLHYGLFLKVLGLSVEEAIVFWRKSFMGGKITEDVFNKEHKYNIRHSYGLEGRRANYPAKSCQQLLMVENAAYGCPYRHFTEENLQTGLLKAYSAQGISSENLGEVMGIVRSGTFHAACARVFEITHASCGVKKNEGLGNGTTVTHPNHYAARSIELESEMKVD